MSAATLVKCPKCGALMMPHRVCKSCGTYNKKEVVKVEDECFLERQFFRYAFDFRSSYPDVQRLFELCCI